MDTPAWNNTTEYLALDAPELLADMVEVDALTKRIAAISEFTLENLWAIAAWRERASVLNANLSVYVSSALALDALNAPALTLHSRVQKLSVALGAARLPSRLFLLRAAGDFVEAYLAHPDTAAERAYWAEERRHRELMLSPIEEDLLARLRPFAMQGYADLYNQIGGTLKVKFETREIGLAEAQSRLRDADRSVRRAAWDGIQNAWAVHEEAVAAVLNNLAGSRLEEYRRRSHTRAIDFLDLPLRQAKIERKTLDSLFVAIAEAKPLVSRALTAMTKALGQDQLDAWDILAPIPRQESGPRYTYGEAEQMISAAFSKITPEMGRFVGMMRENGWIDARVLPNKRGGAYCTFFAKSRTPRVFQTFNGSYQDVSTLAHELGHAWHSWTMRDLPRVQTNYPMTLAETASIFAETALADHVYREADSGTRFGIAFAEVSDAVQMLANIPARFEFEKNFYLARESAAQSPRALGDLMEAAFRSSYGPSLGVVERQFWMTKLHFSIAGVSFYNFPYTFGYLFSLGIYQLRGTKCEGFPELYREILRDTGLLGAEALIEKHLGHDIREPDFWRASLDVVKGKIERLEALVSG